MFLPIALARKEYKNEAVIRKKILAKFDKKNIFLKKYLPKSLFFSFFGVFFFACQSDDEAKTIEASISTLKKGSSSTIDLKDEETEDRKAIINFHRPQDQASYDMALIEHEDFRFESLKSFFSPEVWLQTFKRVDDDSDFYSDKVKKVYAWDFDQDGLIDMIEAVDENGRVLYTAADFNKNGQIDMYIDSEKELQEAQKNQ